MIRVGDMVQPRGSRRQFLVDAYNEEHREWVLLALDTCQVVRISDNVARTIHPVRWDR
jgi:hypothetical protein